MAIQDKTDEELMLMSVKGKNKGLHALYYRYKVRVFNFALRLLGHRSEAEEVTLNIFGGLFKRKYEFKEDELFIVWLFTLLLEFCREKIRDRPQEVAPDEWFKFHYQKETAGLSTIEETQQPFQDAIESLPQNLREILVMRELEKFSYDRMSKILRISTEEVCEQLFQAREHVRAQLTEILYEDI